MEIDYVGSYVTVRSYLSFGLWVCTWGFEKEKGSLWNLVPDGAGLHCFTGCAQPLGTAEGSQTELVHGMEAAVYPRLHLGTAVPLRSC